MGETVAITKHGNSNAKFARIHKMAGLFVFPEKSMICAKQSVWTEAAVL